MNQFRWELPPLRMTTALPDLRRVMQGSQAFDMNGIVAEALKGLDMASLVKQAQLDAGTLDMAQALQGVVSDVKPLDIRKVIEESFRNLAFDNRGLIAEAQPNLGSMDLGGPAKTLQLAWATQVANAFATHDLAKSVEGSERDAERVAEGLLGLSPLFLLKMLNAALVTLQALLMNLEHSTDVEVPDAVEVRVMMLIALVTILTLIAEDRSSGC